MEKIQTKTIWDEIRGYLYIFCGAMGCAVSICNALRYQYVLNRKTAGVVCIIAILVIGIAGTFRKNRKKLLTACFWIGAITAAFIYREMLWSEVTELMWQMSALMKQYYQSAAGNWVMKPYSGNDISVGLIIPAALAALFLASVFGKNMYKIVGYWGIAMLFLLPFLMGSVLRTDGVILLTICGIGLHNGAGPGSWKRDAAAALVLVTAFGAGNIFLKESVTTYVEKPDELREDITKLLDRVGSGGTAKGGVGAGNVGIYDELSPGETVQLTVRAKDRPSADLYLKGYVGGVYEPQKWSGTNMRGLEAMTGKTQEEIESSPYKKLSAENGVEQELEIERIDADASYTYYPYYSNYTDAALGADGMARGNREKIYQVSYYNFWTLANMKAEPWEDAYSEFVKQHYLEVPENVKLALQDAVDATKGVSRREILKQIREYLAGKTSYSLKPGKTPAGEDTVLYFLQENQEGYCVHYATAAAVLLRLNGIPSRYVGGYVVRKGEFRSDENGMKADVTGANAHAWAEYYVKGFGWIPFEATPAYTGLDYEPGDALTGYDGPGDALTGNHAGAEEDADGGNSDAAVTDEDSENASQGDANGAGGETAAQGDANSGDGETAAKGDTNGGDGEKSGQNGGGDGVSDGGADASGRSRGRAIAGRIAGYVLWITGGLILLISVFLLRQSIQRRKKYGTEKAFASRVCQMFCYFYEMIRYFGFPEEINPQSIGFAEELSRRFPSVAEAEAEQFMELIEKANYGSGNIAREDEKFAEQIYRRIRRDGMSQISAKKKIWMKIWKFY